MTRFTKLAMSIPYFHPEVHLDAIKSRLRLGKFQEAIPVAKPKTLAEFHEKAKGQMDIGELQQAQKVDKPLYKDEDKTRDSKWTFKRIPRYDSYAQFNTGVMISSRKLTGLLEILNSKLIKPPREAGNYPEAKNLDKFQYCTFHQKHGHTTDECVIAKDQLERLARQGHLDNEKDKAHTTPPDQPRGVINCISGGYARGGQMSSTRKRTYRAMLVVENTTNNQEPTLTIPELTFHSSDFNSSDLNLNDPVVIILQLRDLIVRKVLLDSGSSADVLLYSTFGKMKLINNILQQSVGNLVGFSGEQVPVLGSVWTILLPQFTLTTIKLGNATTQV
ncbi:uncharacterized protein [Arachis hypogaea]|uniref:uncharacterized protein n=1 Tax=Arachis hypogaea TaxID=3818 RepID=UPI003B212120